MITVSDVPIYFIKKYILMPKNLRSKAAVEDALMIALVMCINMSIYIRNALKPNVPSEKVHSEDWGNASHRRRNGSNLFSRTGAIVQSLSARVS